MPTDHGTDLGIDLFELYDVGSHKLPELATEYSIAAVGIATATAQATPLFTRPSEFGGVNGPLGPEWLSFSKTVGWLLDQTAKNLDDTGRALVMAADAYAEADDAAKRKFDQLKHEPPMR